MQPRVIVVIIALEVAKWCERLSASSGINMNVITDKLLAVQLNSDSLDTYCVYFVLLKSRISVKNW